jgi:hypothetical protein
VLAVALAVAVAALGAGVLIGRPATDPPAAGAAAPLPTAAGPALASGVAATATEEEQPRLSDGQKRVRSVNNLKQIALAFHNHHDANGQFPNVLRDDQGTPTLSWRVAILPYLEQNELYNRFHLDEPWDSEHNAKLIPLIPKVFQVGGEGEGKTYYQGFAGKGTALDRSEPVRLQNITDGTSNTVLVVEGGEAVEWSRPVDLPYSAKRPLPKLGGPFPDVFHAAFCDGSVHTLRKDFDEKTMRLAITRDDGMPFDIADIQARPRPATNSRPPRNQRNEEAALIEEARRAVEQARIVAGRNALKGQSDQEQLKMEVQRLRDEVAALRAEVERLKKRP